ncbi:MAG TPA: hypothetical protein VFX03_02045, partial [Thermomicrobiales bacterium]|nr:hypothetical protein [Thermomicrobiales bacterium]
GDTPGVECLGSNWVTEVAACWSLIGRVGSGAPFAVGFGTSFTATSAGRLYLGVNDDIFGDNVGSWTATVTAAPA